jgi:hypothetical protein
MGREQRKRLASVAARQYSRELEIAWSHVREPLDFDDVIEWSVTGLDGQYPTQLVPGKARMVGMGIREDARRTWFLLASAR